MHANNFLFHQISWKSTKGQTFASLAYDTGSGGLIPCFLLMLNKTLVKLLSK